MLALIDEHNAAAPVDRRRRAARALPRAEHAPAAARRARASTRSSSRAPCARFRPSGPGCPRLQIVVSIDGLQPEHDERRKPATYDRILKHIDGHQITVHCTVTRQQVQRDGLPRRVPDVLVGATPDTRQIWISLYTPQVGETVGRDGSRRPIAQRVVADLLRAADAAIPKLADAEGHDRRLSRAAGVARRVHLRADDDVRVGRPRAARSRRASSAAIPTAASAAASRRRGSRPSARHRLPGGLRVGAIFDASSLRVGQVTARPRPTFRSAAAADSLTPAEPQACNRPAILVRTCTSRRSHARPRA